METMQEAAQALQSGIKVGRTPRLSGGKSRGVDIQDAASIGMPRALGINN